jgi:hypothetical protein
MKAKLLDAHFHAARAGVVIVTALLLSVPTAADGQVQFRNSQQSSLLDELATGGPMRAAGDLTGMKAGAPAAESSGGLSFDEVFSYDLVDYVCENHLAVADFNRDGLQDVVLVVTRPQLGARQARAILLQNAGNWTFHPTVIGIYPDGYGYAAAAADYNQDGFTDLLIREQHATHVLVNDGTGSFREASSFQPGYYSLAVVDVNGDGLPDVASGTQTGKGGRIDLFENLTGDSFSRAWASQLYGTGNDAIETLLVANLNDDGVPDLLGREIYSGLLVSLLGVRDSFGFQEQEVLRLGGRTFALAAGDIDRDGVTDAAVCVGWGQVQVFQNQGDGTFVKHWESPPLGDASFNLALQDFDGDGLDDVFVGTFDGALRIYRNSRPTNFQLAWNSSVPGDGFTGSAADLDGDGYPELIVGERYRIRILKNRSMNHPPKADASATQETVIAPQGHQAMAILDGSRTFDPDGNALSYLWLADGQILGQGKVFTNLLALGTHDIVLQVDDGRETNTHAIRITVTTPCDAIQHLATAIHGEARFWSYRPALLMSLRMACSFLNTGRSAEAGDQLQRFQNKVRFILGARAPDLATEWIQAAQYIRDALHSAIEFSLPTYVIIEGDPSFAVTVNRLGDLSSTVTVRYRTVQGTARAGLDYVAQRGTLVFPPLVASQTIHLTTLGDGTSEGEETMRILLSRPSKHASLGQKSMAKVSIHDGPIVWALHDADPDYRTPPFDDTLQALDAEGNVLVNITGINLCQTIGGWRAITAVDEGRAVLLSEFCINSGLTKYDLKGNKLFSIKRDIYAAAVAKDGNIYARTHLGTLLKISSDGIILAEAAVDGIGIDLAADELNHGVYVVGKDITYVDSDLNVLWRINPITWLAVSVDVASDGSAWVAERRHPNMSGSADRLFHVSNEGQVLHSLRLDFTPFCVRADPKDDSVYVVGTALEKYDRQGRQIFSIPFADAPMQLYGFSLALDDVGNAWVGTWTDVRKYSPYGELLLTTSRFATASDTWISIGR